MDLEIAREILKWAILGVGINATTLLIIVGMIGYFVIQVKRDTREISHAVRDVAEMTREVLRRTQ